MKVFSARIVQYMRPNGRKAEQAADLDVSVQTQYEAMLEAGYNLAAEVLQTDMISITIENNLRDCDSRVCTNGPAVPAGYEEMLKNENWIKFTEKDANGEE